MTIEQHAEAAMQKLAIENCWDTEADLSPVKKIVQSAIDEATAKQMSWIAVLNSEIARLEADVVRANTERVHTQKAYQETNREVVQTLGKALHYPWFKDDQANFPGATEADGVCVGDHVAESLAAEAAKRIAELEGLWPLIEEYADCGIVMANAIHTKNTDRQQRASHQRRETLAKIKTILKGGAE